MKKTAEINTWNTPLSASLHPSNAFVRWGKAILSCAEGWRHCVGEDIPNALEHLGSFLIEGLFWMKIRVFYVFTSLQRCPWVLGSTSTQCILLFATASAALFAQQDAHVPIRTFESMAFSTTRNYFPSTHWSFCNIWSPISIPILCVIRNALKAIKICHISMSWTIGRFFGLVNAPMCCASFLKQLCDKHHSSDIRSPVLLLRCHCSIHLVTKLPSRPPTVRLESRWTMPKLLFSVWVECCFPGLWIDLAVQVNCLARSKIR